MQNPTAKQTLAWLIFRAVTAWPKTLIVLGLLLIISCASFIPGLVKDTRSDAFLPDDEPALIYRDKVKAIFGLTDPMVVAVVNEGPQGIFNPDTLKLVDWLTQEISRLNNVDPDRVTSLATENNITGNKEGMLVEPFWDELPDTQQQADSIRSAIMNFPLYQGSLVAEDGTGTLIIAELIDQTKAQSLYDELLKVVKHAPRMGKEQIHVAGEGAVSGYLGSYIDADAQRLNPLAAIIITLVLFIAFRTLLGTLLPNFVVLATLASTLGLMAITDVSFFVITNGLLPVLIGIAVADSIHIFSQYYEEVARHPNDSPRDNVVRTMLQMWRPITMTTLTTQAGFLGLYLASVMPPMKYFGLFAMIGVGAAWLFSIVVVPGWLSLLKLKSSPAYQQKLIKGQAEVDIFGRLMTQFGKVIMRNSRAVLMMAVTIGFVGIYGATQLELNEARIRVFQNDEPIVQADQVINRLFDGVHYLDILIETAHTEGIFLPDNLKRIEALQTFLENLPHVGGTASVVDYLKQMNRSMSEGRSEAYLLPNDKDLIAQYFLLYSANSDPNDFEAVVDYDYRLANVRVSMDSGKYSDEKHVVEAVQAYLDSHFNTATISANLSGRVNVDYHWIKRLGDTNWGSVSFALLLVWLMATLAFRSVVAGIITVTPVTLTVLVVYAVMSFSGIWLSISTSMFAAIAIGLGVDFSVHTIERLQVLLRDEQRSLDESITLLFASTGRALLFNFVALSLGFFVLVTSKVVVLQEFGAIVALAVMLGFLTSLMLLPALVKVFRPKFLGFDRTGQSVPVQVVPRIESAQR
ncbi:MAG: MMPL family transporter [Candidatus Thiodiazotropha sp. (ex Lucinoma borealis)]|nr:MMPL family transporter [Candidatus Thiodiazotropha sp. (ex Lucinoma borealis)]